MVPFTYRNMPTNQYIKQLIDEGYVGKPYHLSMRYFAGYARDGAYAWRFDEAKAGSGILGDLGSHWLDMARWFLGEVTEVSAHRNFFVDREPRPDGSSYTPVEDSAVISARFESGAAATLQVSAVCWEGTPFGQIHELDLHGSGGTLHALNDWNEVQEVRGVRAGEQGPAKPFDHSRLVVERCAARSCARHLSAHLPSHRGDDTSSGSLRSPKATPSSPTSRRGQGCRSCVAAAITSATTDGSWQSVPAT